MNKENWKKFKDEFIITWVESIEGDIKNENN